MKAFICVHRIRRRMVGIIPCILLYLLLACSDDEGSRQLLVTWKVPTDYQLLNSNYDRGFLLASDAEGNVLATTELYAGKSVALFSDDVDAIETCTFTEIYIQAYPSAGIRVQAFSYTDIPRGASWPAREFVDTHDQEKPSQGNVTLNLLNPTGEQFVMSANAGTAERSWSTPAVVTVPLGHLPGLVYVLKQYPNPMQFAVFENLQPGQTLDVDVHALEGRLSAEAATIPEGIDDYNVELWGFPVRDNYAQYCWLGYGGKETAPWIYYPDVPAFARFGSHTSISHNNIHYQNYNKSAKYDFTMIDPEFVVMSEKASDISFSSSDKEYDRAIVALGWADENFSTSWLVHTAPGADRHIVLPTLPTSVKEVIPVDFPMENLLVVAGMLEAFEGVEGYSQWVRAFSESETGEQSFRGFDRNWNAAVVDL
ncbi:hypothetical protein [Parachryseolinea silvisoli]|uniref:hypothetical protein n=1 Tax=Parachryseolinea silvisoli TaxID=2873601 RepID=UPI002265D114|nr:hypothetical protein [Parachryseolinea silvisoli]MCD9015034.1 hypothetical protein [Parachryseolinea silvisoli]